MKKLFTLLAVIAVLSSCQKKQCWRCESSAVKATSGYSAKYEILCDKTERQIRRYEEDNSSFIYDGIEQYLTCTEN